MNLPNKLTVTRLVLSPVFFLCFFLPNMVAGFSPVLYTIILALLYGVMELTDLLDGKIARKRNLVTDIGKVIDPFSDVIMHLTFFTCMVYIGYMPIWAFILIIWREFAQSFTRMLLMGKGTAMAANIFGKAKTCLYALSCICGFIMRIVVLFGQQCNAFLTVVKVLFGLAAVASVISYLIYVKAIKDSKALSDMTR